MALQSFRPLATLATVPTTARSKSKYDSLGFKYEVSITVFNYFESEIHHIINGIDHS